MRKIIIHIDGAAWLWRRAGWGFHAYEEGRGFLTSDHGRVPCEPKRSTSNAAEYYALRKALEWAKEAGLANELIIIKSDSKLVISQLFRGWRCRDRSLPYVEHMEAVQHMLMFEFNGRVTGKLIPREHNRHADELAKAGIRKEL